MRTALRATCTYVICACDKTVVFVMHAAGVYSVYKNVLLSDVVLKMLYYHPFQI